MRTPRRLDAGTAGMGAYGGTGTPGRGTRGVGVSWARGQRDGGAQCRRAAGTRGPTRCPHLSPAPPGMDPPRSSSRPSPPRAASPRVPNCAPRPPRVSRGGSVGPLPPPSPPPHPRRPRYFWPRGIFGVEGPRPGAGTPDAVGGVSIGTARPGGPAPPAAESRPGTAPARGAVPRLHLRVRSGSASRGTGPTAAAERRYGAGGVRPGVRERGSRCGPAGGGPTLCQGNRGHAVRQDGGGRVPVFPQGLSCPFPLGGPVDLPVLPRSSGGPILPWGWAAVGCSVGPELPKGLLQINGDPILSKRVWGSRPALGVPSSLGGGVVFEVSHPPPKFWGSHPSGGVPVVPSIPSEGVWFPILPGGVGSPLLPQGLPASSCRGGPILPPGSGGSHPAWGGRGGPFPATSPRSPARPARSALWPRGCGRGGETGRTAWRCPWPSPRGAAG